MFDDVAFRYKNGGKNFRIPKSPALNPNQDERWGGRG